MITNMKSLILIAAGLVLNAGSAFADSVMVSEVHTSTSKTITFTVLGMEQTTGIIVIAAAVVVVILIFVVASRSSSRSTTTIIK